MSAANVQLGIDHGTSNSSIAVMESDGPRVIKPDGVNVCLPSAVYYDKRGRMFVGSAAMRAMLTNPSEEGNGHTGYKVKIGQSDIYPFPAARKNLTGPELGGLVMGTLLKAYREETNNDPYCSVITVPAKFEHAACEGTLEAAQKAGLLFASLLQEPIAAALAYGFTSDDQRAQWVVFDLGGGTLDVSLVIVRKGQMVVPEDGHHGDNRLGGRKFDRELLGYVLTQLKQKYALDRFHDADPTYSPAWGRLLLAVEQAKIELSRREEAVVSIDGGLCKDDRGQAVEVEVPITRKLYQSLIAPDIEKAIHCCQILMEKNRLAPQDITRLILVGGPTKTPFIQQALAERLGIPIDASIDPMTAVAQGAAIYATTLEVPPDIVAKIRAKRPAAGTNGQCTIQLKYERSSKQPTYFVVGKVEGPAVAQGGITAEIVRDDGGWSSGKLTITPNGVFTATLLLVDSGKPHETEFTTVIRDAADHVLAKLEEPRIWYPYPGGGDVRPRLANSLRVAIKGNRTLLLVKQGVDLPTSSTKPLVTTKALQKGSGEDVLRIPILEGITHLFGAEDEQADCCAHVGTLTIVGNGDRMHRDLPEGAEIELKIEETESRQIRVIAYIPLVNEEFEAAFKKGDFNVSLDQIKERFESIKRATNEAEKLQQAKPLSEVGEKLEKIRQLRVIDEIGKDIQRAESGEQDACYRAYIRILELAGAMNVIRDLQTPARILRHIEHLGSVVQGAEGETLAKVKREFGEACQTKDKTELAAIENALDELDRQVRRRPLADVQIDVWAFPQSFRGSQEQIQAFRDVEAVYKEIDELEKANGQPSPALLDRARAVHDRLLAKWPELPGWRQKLFDDFESGKRAAPHEGTDVNAARR